MAKLISHDRDAREKLLKGVDEMARTVGSTLGPLGHNVAIDRGYDAWVIHDGVNVARQIELEDASENLGVKIVREALNKQVEEVGDGTTVTAILANALVKECDKVINSGTHAMLLRKGLEKGRDTLLEELDKLSIPVKTLEEKIQVATISAEDEELGEMIGKTIDKMGTEAILTVEESKLPETFVEIQEGMQFDKGYKSPYFVTDPTRMEATVEDTFILITDMNIVNINELLPLLNGDPSNATDETRGLGKFSKNLVIIAPDITDNALEAFVLNKVRGFWNFSVVQAPLVGQFQKDFLQDLAILTGGTVITEDAGQRFAQATIPMLGRAKRVTSTKDATIIVGGEGDQKAIIERINSIKAMLDRNETKTEFESEKLRQRIAKLSAGVAVIKVGGQTEVEMKERKERAEDAIPSTQAAVDEGIVAGGETVYLKIREKLDKKDTAQRILYNALAQPFKTLVENAGYDGGEKIAELKAFNDYEFLDETTLNTPESNGFDVTTGQIVDLIKAGIIDPVKVSKCAIANAVSVAIQVMTSDTVIVEKTKDEKK